jgi:lambda family phage tail tape measure protein
VAYRADIEIAVKGAQELKRLGDQINATGKLVEGLNKYLENIGGGGVVRNINNLQETVGKAAAVFNRAALGTREATIAAKNYIAATNELNSGLREKLALLKQVNEVERQQRLGAAGIRETTQYGGPIGPGQATPVALSSPLRGRTEQLLAERKGAAELNTVLQDLEAKQRQLENSKLDAKAAAIQAALDKQAAATLETATQTEKLTARQQDFITRTDAAAAAARRQTAEFIRQQRLLRELQRGAPTSTVEFGPGGPGFSGGFTPAQRQQANQQASLRILQEQNKIRRQTLDILSREERFEIRLRDIRERNLAAEKQRSKTREATSNAVIGGAFPLLFGQGLGASIGGGLGGFAGGMAGGQFGFGLSLIGTAVGASLDQAVNSAKAFEKSLRQGGDAAGYLEQQLGFIDPTIRSQIQNLQNSGQTAAAAELAFQQLAKTVGEDGAKAFLAQGKASNELEVSLKKVINSFVAAGFAANKYFQDLKYGPGGKFTDLLPEQFRPEPTPEAPQVTSAFAQRTQQLQRDADLLREQVKLTSISAKTELDRFVATSKNVAQKEYENQLSQIAVQLKNKEIDIEQNKQLITAANLQLSIKLGEIERNRVQELQRRQEEQRQAAERAAREAEQARRREIDLIKTSLQLQNQISSAFLEQANIQIEIDRFVTGESAAIQEQLRAMDGVYTVKESILQAERQAALLSADNAEQQELIAQYYDRQLDILQKQKYLEVERSNRRKAELALEERLTALRFKQDKESAVIGIQQQRDKVSLDIAAFTENPRAIEAQKLYLDQVKRAYDAEAPITKEMDRLREEINANATNTTEQTRLNKELAAQQDKLTAIREELALLDQLEQKQLALQQFFAQYGQLITSVSDSIADAVTNGVANMVAGTQTAKQVFAQFLNTVAQALLDTAKKMIATYIAIGIAKIFAGLGGGGGGSFKPLTNIEATNFSFNPAGITGGVPGGLFAKGGTFGASGTSKFASGGIVSSPTMFKFADGGTTRTGLMGEAGPEAIMPLRRGVDGKLGVEANGLREALDRERSAGQNNAPVLNMSFQSTTINGVEYVSRDQLEAAMAETRRQASREGAQRGMSMTLDKLQQSPSTRSRVGMR